MYKLIQLTQKNSYNYFPIFLTIFIFYISAILKKNVSIEETINKLKPMYKEDLLKCAIMWNVNSKNCQVAQVSFNMIEYVISSSEKVKF